MSLVFDALKKGYATPAPPVFIAPALPAQPDSSSYANSALKPASSAVPVAATAQWRGLVLAALGGVLVAGVGAWLFWAGRTSVANTPTAAAPVSVQPAAVAMPAPVPVPTPTPVIAQASNTAAAPAPVQTAPPVAMAVPVPVQAAPPVALPAAVQVAQVKATPVAPVAAAAPVAPVAPVAAVAPLAAKRPAPVLAPTPMPAPAVAAPVATPVAAPVLAAAAPSAAVAPVSLAAAPPVPPTTAVQTRPAPTPPPANTQVQVNIEANSLDVREAFQTFLRQVKLGQYPEAQRTADQISVAMGSTHVMSLRAQGYLALQQNNLVLAKSFYLQLQQAQPGDREAGLNLALVEWRLGEVESASARVARLVDRFPNDQEIRALYLNLRKP